MPIPALTNYRPLRYSHVQIEPGQSHALAADPWAYLYSYLLRAGKRRKGANRENFRRAIFYAELAKEFFRASDVVELPAQATLLYYGMLNLVKCYLSVEGVQLETTIEHHGASLPQKKIPTVHLSGPTANSINILCEFASRLGQPVAASEDLTIKDIFKNVPELHAVYSGIFPKEKPILLGVRIDFCTNEAHKILYTEISYEKRYEGVVKIDRFLKGERAAYFGEKEDRGGRVYYRSKNTRRPDNWKNVKRAYNAILNEYDRFSVCSMLTRNGYQYYINLEDPKFSHLVYSLMAMFFLGSAARYRPTTMQELMDGEMRPLITEAAALCPKQFQYHLVSLITHRLCAVPFADLT